MKKNCASSWLFTKIIPRCCTVNRTEKMPKYYLRRYLSQRKPLILFGSFYKLANNYWRKLLCSIYFLRSVMCSNNQEISYKIFFLQKFQYSEILLQVNWQDLPLFRRIVAPISSVLRRPGISYWNAGPTGPSTNPPPESLVTTQKSKSLNKCQHNSHRNSQKKMQQCIKMYCSMFIWSSTCFGRHTAHHQELKTALATSGFAYVKGCWTLRLLDADSVQQTQRPTTFHVCKTKGC